MTVIPSYVKHILVLSSILFFYCHSAISQNSVTFKTGTFPLLKTEFHTRSSGENEYLFFKADHVLSLSEKEILLKNRIEILYALHQHIYWVRIKATTDNTFSKYLFDVNPDYKIGITTENRSASDKLRLSIAPGIKQEEILEWAINNNVTLLDMRALIFGFIDVEVQDGVNKNIINTPWISYIEAIPTDELLNYRALPGERGWGLKSPLTRGLDGSGITVGIGDEGRIGTHEDISSSVLDLASFGISQHTTMVTGNVTGAGVLDPAFGFGYAPNAHVIIRNFSDILWSTPQYISDFNMSLTNNSYGSSLTDCVIIGDYDGTSAALDAMMRTYPSLLHVFAAGNSGGINCSPYPSGFATVAGIYQASKNVLTVGAVNITDGNASFSSRGPVDDGRIKPEAVANGSGRFSTIDNNLYTSGSGTSFSSPATTGMATLLYQRYRQLHNDSLPDAALIKNVICNGADDLGNTGPDFIYGFGRINGVRSVEILESNHFKSLSVDDQQVVTTSIPVPSGVASIDIMLNWTDPASAPYETVTLVNDLDLAVVSPAGDTTWPWKLNYTPSGVSNPATTGPDHLNNIEQVTIQTATTGTYTILVKGYQVPMGPQLCWLTWDLQHSAITIQSPIGGEVFKPGNINLPNDRQYIRWDAFGTGSSTFNVDYTINGGTSWISLATNVASTRRYQDWFIPNTPSDQMKVRVTASNGMMDTSDQYAVIMPPPGNVIASTPCNGYIQLTWNPVTGANHYQLYSLKNEVLTSLDTISNTSIVLSGFPPDSAIWISVAGVFPSGKEGLRARAVLITPGGGNQCTWNNDLRLDSLIAPKSGRQFTSSALTNKDTIKVHITNEGLVNASGFSLSYKVNNGSIITQAFGGTLNAGAGVVFSFNQVADFSATGNYNIRVWSTYASDPFHKNDTLKVIVRHLPNPPVTLPWTENFDAIPDVQILSDEIGLLGLNAWDADLQPTCRVRTFAGSPFCHSGERALTVDATQNTSSKHGDLFLTLNMDGHSVSTDDIRMSLYFMHHEIIPDVNNTESIWIRGSDADTFLLLTYLPNDANLRGVYQHLTDLHISPALQQGNQNFSSSFQVKFSHDVKGTAGQTTSEDGQTIDDISFDLIQKDIKIDQLIHPQAVSCGLGMEMLQVSVSNTTIKTVNNVSISWQVNGGMIHSMSIDSLQGDTTFDFILNPAIDFSAPGAYNLKIWVNSIEDNYHNNDTLRTQIVNSSLINDFPYREGFESDSDGWVSGGINSTWMEGTPGKEIISHAAEGQHVWTTNLSGPYNPDETSYLYSPCFNFSGFTQPFLSFAFQYDLESGYDYTWVEYRIEGSNDWIKLGAMGNGTNWYNDASNRWNGTRPHWLTTGISIPVTDTIVQFRWVMQSDVGVEMEGLAIDQVNVYDRKQIYDGSPLQMTQPVSGNNWVHFDQGGQRIFSINPEGQDLGNVTLNLYKSNQSFILSDSLYLLSRNWVLTCTNSPQSEIKLRGYYTASEANNLVNATGCTQCISARDAFDVTSLRYTGQNEDGLYNNDTPSQVLTYPPDSTEIFSYENGYYAEWNTSGLSEWWITSPVTKKSGQLSRTISSSSDDAEEHQDNGSVDPVREAIAMTDKDGHQTIGWRFKNINVPSGSYISNAVIKWKSYNTATTAANWIMQGELSADASAFTTSKYNITSRARSTQVVQFNPDNWTITNQEYTSPDIRHLIQNIVDQPGWINGKDMVLIMRGTGLRESWSYDGDLMKAAQLVITFDSTCADNGILYVNLNASGLQNGSSWTDAYKSFEQALDRAAHCPGITQIWIAGGTYSPYFEVSRSAGFVIRSGLSVYGGFLGTETNINQRVYGMNPTILSGNIGSAGNMADNLYHVVTIPVGGTAVLLDGITIKDGTANGGTFPLQNGSAIFNQGILSCNQVILTNNSAPAFYNAPGSQLVSNGIVQVKL